VILAVVVAIWQEWLAQPVLSPSVDTKTD